MVQIFERAVFFTVEVSTPRGLVTYYVLSITHLSTRSVYLCGVTLSRRAKLGVSCGVRVPVGKGLATRQYRVLVPLRSGVSFPGNNYQFA